jgi:hypothetical protein
LATSCRQFDPGNLTSEEKALAWVRWRADATYRPQNLVAWAHEMKIDPAKLVGAVMAADPKIIVPR